jgi:hypothetical protein
VFPTITSRIVLLWPRWIPVCVRIEPVSESFAISDIDPTSLRLTSAGTGTVESISAMEPKHLLVGDYDRNGVSEYQACFAMSDVSRLLGNLRGIRRVTATLEGALVDGRRFCSDVSFTLINFGKWGLAASVTPNPLNPEGTLRFTLGQAGPVTIQLFDLNGRLVRILANRQQMPAGPNSVRLDGTNRIGARLASGVYFYRITTGEGEVTGRFTVLK